jgi:hypothetical protein
MSEALILEVFNRYSVLIEKILSHFAGDKFREEVKIAKSQFFDNAGILDESSQQFELRMSQFFDWYFFSRELSGYGQTPLETIHMTRELRFDDEEIKLIENLRKHHHGLFEFRKIKDGDIYIKDLFKSEKLVVKQSPWIYGFDTSEFFEARLIPFNDSFIFTKGFCFHPSEARKYILSEIKRHRKDPDLDVEEMMLKLIKMRYRFERYRHVKIDVIYSNNSQLG